MLTYLGPRPVFIHVLVVARSVLTELTRRFTESDVAMMLTLLNAVGLQLRSADPSAMKVGGWG
jgi:hypothetical protein